MCPGVGVVTFADDATIVIFGDFGSDFFLHGFASGGSVAFVGGGIVFVASNKCLLFVAAIRNLGACGFGARD